MRRGAAILFSSLLAFGQQPTPQAPPQIPGTVFTVTTTLVQVDAVVTDSKGRQVTNLGKEDFEVYQDGKLQQLTHFSYVDATKPGTLPRALHARLPADPRPAPTRQLRPEEVRSTIVLVVDDLGLSFESMAFVRSSLRKFVEQQMQPGDLVAVFRTGAGSGALQEFTSNKRTLLTIIDGLHWSPRSRYVAGVFEAYGKTGKLASSIGDAHGPPPTPTPQPVGMSGDAASRVTSYDVRRNALVTVGTLGSVRYIVDALRDLPGRKSVVLFSDGIQLFTPSVGPSMHSSVGMESNDDIIAVLNKLIDQANRAGTVIYTMHTTGLQPTLYQPGAEDRVELGGMTPEARLQTLNGVTGLGTGRGWNYNVAQQGLAYLAFKTGGIPYENSNDLNWGLDRVLEDQRGYYLLGYAPSEGTLGAKDGYRRFHNITVKVRRPGLTVRSRSGFFGETDEETLPHYDDPIEQMRAAMLSPFSTSAIRLRLTALYSRVPKHGPVVRNLLHVDAKDLTFETDEDGVSRAKVNVVAVAVGSGDRPLATVARAFQVHVPAGSLERALRDGVMYTLDVPVKDAGAYQIRVAVRDEATGKTGSARQFIEIPELKKGHFVLSSIVLQDGERDYANPQFVGLTPARRQFHRGSKLEFACVLEKGRGASPESGLDVQVRIVRGSDQQVFSAPAKLEENSGGAPTVHGLLKLADAIEPGDYYLQVVATDHNKRKPEIADQWTDFEVLP